MVGIQLAHIGSQKLSAVVDFITDRWHKMLNATSAQKDQIFCTVVILVQHSFNMSAVRVFIQDRIQQIHFFMQPQMSWNLSIEVLNMLGAVFVMDKLMTERLCDRNVHERQ